VIANLAALLPAPATQRVFATYRGGVTANLLLSEALHLHIAEKFQVRVRLQLPDDDALLHRTAGDILPFLTSLLFSVVINSTLDDSQSQVIDTKYSAILNTVTVAKYEAKHSMGLKEAGLYLRIVREARKLSRDEVAKAAGTSTSQIERLENGKQDTRSTVMLALIDTIQANWKDVTFLQRHPTATDADARHRAAAWLRVPIRVEDWRQQTAPSSHFTSQQREQIIHFLETLTPELLRAFQQILDTALADTENQNALLMAMQIDIHRLAGLIEGYRYAVLEKAHGFQQLLLSTIRVDGGTQLRAKLNQDTVTKYAAELFEGESLHPVDVFYDGREYWLADGFHRFNAYVKADRKTIPCIIHKGSRRDAQLFSLSKQQHKLERTAHDKERGIEMMLFDDEWTTWPDERIAETVGVSSGTVTQIRQQLIAAGQLLPSSD
jgi:transcriptional regulator with XRE-family HTH domain